jgi:hypothetical protein
MTSGWIWTEVEVEPEPASLLIVGAEPRRGKRIQRPQDELEDMAEIKDTGQHPRAGKRQLRPE